MKALIYLSAKKLKNGILDFLKKPARLIVTVLFIALMVFSAVTSTGSSAHHYTRDINELYAIIFGLYTLIFVLISKNGFYNGASMFTMQDVNLIFTSPLNQNTVLSYGLIQQLGRSLMLGFFILFQSGTVCATYGVGYEALIYILVGYGLTVFLSQMLAMVIYSYTSSDEKKHKTIKGVYYTVIACFAAYAVYLCLSNGGINLSNLVSVTQHPATLFFPVSGMTSLLVHGAISADTRKIVCGIAYCIVFWVLYRLAVRFINSDYYEDVLQSTESSFSAIAARKEGKAAETAPKNIKTGKTGINKSTGAAVIYEKHKIENRRSKKLILSMTSLITVIFSIITCFVFSDEPIGVFGINIYIMTMSVATGRWAKELSYPYIFLIPESSFKKLLYTLKSDMPTIIAESILCLAPMYFICYLSVADTLGMILARISFGVLIIGANLFVQKLFGFSDRKKLIVIIYFLFVVIFSLPGIFTAVALEMVMPFYLGLAFTAMSAVNIITALILIFFSRRLLEEV